MSLRNMCSFLATAIWLGATLAGCAKGGSDNASVSSQMAAGNAPAASGGPKAGAPPGMGGGAAPESNETAKAEPKPRAPSAAITAPSPDRYLIRNAIVVLEVKDARVANDQLLAAVREAKGYVSNLNETTDSLGARTVTLQVRVPATLFDSSMQALTSLGKVTDKKVTAEDVTEEYVDTQSTLRNLNKTEARLIDHLSRTGKLSDTLLIEKELTRVREEIEKREGRLRFLAHRVEFSTIDVTLREAPRAQSPVPAESYSTGKQATDATRSLVEFLLGVWTIAIWLGIWAVVWVPIVVVGWLIVRVMLKNRPKSDPPPRCPPG